MKLAALFSGGKDSTFAISCAQEMGHCILCLITMHPKADDSALFHYPNSWVTEYLAEAMKLPLIECHVWGHSKEDEMKALEETILQAKSTYGINGIVHGGISSNYQKQAFEKVCVRQRIEAVAKLVSLSKSCKFNLTFEGGEAETLVIDCPLYQKQLQIKAAAAYWDGQRGIFEIQGVALVEKK